MTIHPHQVKRVLRKLKLVTTDGFVQSDRYSYAEDAAAGRIAQELNAPPARRGDIVLRDDLEYAPLGMVVLDRTRSSRHVHADGWYPTLSRDRGVDFFVEYNPDHPEARHE